MQHTASYMLGKVLPLSHKPSPGVFCFSTSIISGETLPPAGTMNTPWVRGFRLVSGQGQRQNMARPMRGHDIDLPRRNGTHRYSREAGVGISRVG